MSPAPTPPTLALSPGPIASGQRATWQASRSLTHALCPTGPELALGSTAAKAGGGGGKQQGVEPRERQAFVVRWDSVPDYVVPLYTRSYTIFQSLQRIAAQSETSGGQGQRALPSAEQVSNYSRVCALYVDAIQHELLLAGSPAETDADAEGAPSSGPSSSAALPPPPPPAALSAWASARTSLALLAVLYLPRDGLGAGVVGEELLHWLNSADCGPTEEEGDRLFSGPHGGEVWREEGYWSYLLRSLLRGFLASAGQLVRALEGHRSRAVNELAPRLAELIGAYPRSTAFGTERAFVAAQTGWRASLRLLARPLEGGSGWAREAVDGEPELDEGEAAELEENVGALLALLTGDERRVLEESVDWREALGAWGLWVRPGLKRDDLPEVVERVLERLPALADVDGDDDGDAEDEDERQANKLQLALVRGDPVGAAALAVDGRLPWLAAHFVDLLEHVGLVPPSTTTGGPGLRDHYVLAYVGHLAADPALWQVAAEYAASVRGQRGSETVGALLTAVGLDRELEEGGEEEKGEEEPAVDIEKAEEVIRLLYAHGLDDRARQLARTVAGRLAAERQFGLATAFAVRAGDVARLEDVADKVLGSYVQNGPEEFIAHVESIPPSLVDPLSPLSAASAPALIFLPRYRAFLAAYAAGDRKAAAGVLCQAVSEGLAPRSFWAVLMVDLVPLLDDADMLIPTETAFVLLGQLEDLLSQSTDEPKTYLGHLANLRKSSSTGSSSGKPTTDKEREGEQEDDEVRWREVRKSLDVVRLALARYLARDLTMS